MTMAKKIYKEATYRGERSLFMSEDAYLENVTFEDGESPLKESKNLEIVKCTFKWKYPVWYADNVTMKSCYLSPTARSGIWYTNHITLDDCQIDAPKTFRRGQYITINSSSINDASETLWSCKDVKINSTKANGDYFLMNSENIEINHLELNGNYFLDGAKNVVVRDSILNSKDSFWNVENATVINCKINGEYLGWNSKNLTFINCEISSLQGLCYINGLKLINCKLLDSTLCFEYCENIAATIIDEVESIINPTSGIIRALEVKKLIVNENSRAEPGKMRVIHYK